MCDQSIVEYFTQFKSKNTLKFIVSKCLRAIKKSRSGPLPSAVVDFRLRNK